MVRHVMSRHLRAAGAAYAILASATQSVAIAAAQDTVVPSPLPPAVSPAAAAAAGPPGTEILLLPLHVRDGVVSLGAPANITARAGYDNQPSFTPDGRSVLYTSIRADGQADIYRYHPGSRRTTRVTATPESEYSATVMPGGRRISVVRVEADSTQRLWQMALDGTDFRLLLDRVKPVGYHAWGDPRTLALFVLGEPSTLRVADVRSGDARVVASSIGRSLHRIPGERAISFVRKRSADDWWIERLDLRSGRITPLARTLPGSEDYAWTPGGVALMAHGDSIYQWTHGDRKGWRPVAAPTLDGLGRISRMAVSPTGTQLAIVAEEPPRR